MARAQPHASGRPLHGAWLRVWPLRGRAGRRAISKMRTRLVLRGLKRLYISASIPCTDSAAFGSGTRAASRASFARREPSSIVSRGTSPVVVDFTFGSEPRGPAAARLSSQSRFARKRSKSTRSIRARVSDFRLQNHGGLV
eukprot:scaffold732_cov60-Phaeocystis_antarctica.AAC.18